MNKPAVKCPKCNGWAFEPGVTPMQNCSGCNGTGRARELVDDLASRAKS